MNDKHLLLSLTSLGLLASILACGGGNNADNNADNNSDTSDMSTQTTGDMGSVSTGDALMLGCERISQETVWEDRGEGVDYVIPGGVGCSPLQVSAKLTIAPGVTIAMGPNSGLIVNEGGQLIARGSAQAPILFQGTVPTPGHWSSLRIDSAVDASELEFVTVRHAGPAPTGPALNASSSVRLVGAVSLKDVTIEQGDAVGLVVTKKNLGLTEQSLERVRVSGHAEAVLALTERVPLLGGAGNSFAGNTLDHVRLLDPATNDVLTFPTLDVPYMLHTDSGLSITGDGALTLEPGAQLIVPGGKGINVSERGQLIAAGTSQAPVVMRGELEEAGSWEGLVFTGSSSGRLESVVVRHTGADERSILLENNAQLTLKQVTFEQTNNSCAIQGDDNAVITVDAATTSDGTSVTCPE